MDIPPALIRRAWKTATASARGRGRNARPSDIAAVLRERYDPAGIHTLAEWLEVANMAVASVQSARELMDIEPPYSSILY